MMTITLPVQLVHAAAKIPTKAHDEDAGFDLHSVEEVSLKPGERKLVSTGLCIALPKGYEGQVRPRSGLALTKGITVLNSPGTIDAGYRGVVGVILIVGGLSFFPALALGPIVEHFAMMAGQLF